MEQMASVMYRFERPEKKQREDAIRKEPPYDIMARRIANEVGQAVASWRNEAQRLGISGTEIDRMASAFEHTDLRQATNRP